MTRHLFPIVSALALTVSAGTALAGDWPASGEQPFPLAEGAAAITLTRAEVMAAAVAAPPAVGEMCGVSSAASSGWAQSDRAAVVNELRVAIGHGYHVPAGEAS